jgi:putative colanic acid biosynthesis glycosyltransferase
MKSTKTPLVSVITVVFNGEKTLEASIKSVANQTYKNIEYIIIDGDSNDQTKDIIKKHDEHIDYWISEPDNGIYDAMNKAISISNGEWLYFLGSDDFLIDTQVIYRAFQSDNSDFSILIGNVIEDSEKVFLSTISWKTNLFNTVHHQSAFYSRSLFEDFLYNPKLKVVADYELNFLIFLKHCKFKYLNQTVARFSTTGLSKNSSEYVNVIDYFNARKSHIGPFKNLFFSILFLFNVIRRKIEAKLT